MRKSSLDSQAAQLKMTAQTDWLDLDQLARVELSSEAPEHPIEAALVEASGSGWRAQQSGEQTIRIIFDTPQRLRQIHLVFEEHERARTQEFLLRWSADGRDYREIVRQQWNFNPVSSTRQTEDYRVELDHVSVLELIIKPDISGGPACASLAALRLA